MLSSFPRHSIRPITALLGTKRKERPRSRSGHRVNCTGRQTCSASQSLVWNGGWLVYLPLGSPEVFLKSKTAPEDVIQSPQGVDSALQKFHSKVSPALGVNGGCLTLPRSFSHLLGCCVFSHTHSISGPSQPPSPPPTRVSSVLHILMLDYTK